MLELKALQEVRQLDLACKTQAEIAFEGELPKYASQLNIDL